MTAMVDRETILPLSIGAFLALMAHVVLLPAMADSLRDPSQRAGTKLPDLVVKELRAPAKAEQGSYLTFDMALANLGGDLPDDRQWRDVVYLSADETLSDDDTLLQVFKRQKETVGQTLTSGQWTSPAPGELRAVPRDVKGMMYLIAVTDAFDEIDEAEEGNNTRVVPIEIIASTQPPVLPDLLIDTANAPDRTRIGESLTIEYLAANRGKGAAGDIPWNDAVLLSRDEKPSEDDALIASEPGASTLLTNETYARRVTGKVQLPKNASGPMFLLVIADYGKNIDEADETNNIFVLPITVETLARRPDDPKPEATGPLGPPDLQIPAAGAPPRVMNGETLKVDFIVANRGEGPATEPAWRDRVYLSDDQTIDESDLVLASLERQGPMPVGSHYPVQAIGKVDVPEDKTGRMYVIIHTDAMGDVIESNELNNIRILPIEIEQIVLGKDDSQAETAVAWIAHDDFQKLIAPQSQTEQPALQNRVDPVKNAQTPHDPSPPTVTAPMARLLMREATPSPPQPDLKPAPPRPDPSPEILTPARLVEAKSPVTEPSPKALTSPKAESPATLPLPPRPQVPAEGPLTRGQPVTQPPAETTKPKTQGAPVTQDPATLPQPIAPDIDSESLASATKTSDSATRDPSSTPLPTDHLDPTRQPRAESPLPVKGDPTKLTPAEAPPSRTGEPTKSIPATTPDPKEDGKLATSKPLKGDDGMPRPSPASEDSGKTKPTAENEQTKKPVPENQPANPTSAPRAESRVPPTILKDTKLKVSPGGVIVREGIQIIASTPDITTTSWLVSGPTARNPIASITFSREGKVTQVTMIRETGHANLDSPVQAAFYSFRAKGKGLEKVRDTFTIEITLLLKPEPEKE